MRICFYTDLVDLFLTDSVAKAALRTEMICLAENRKHLEFWFYGSCDYNPFTRQAMRYIQEMRDVLPDSQIEVVVIIDPAAETIDPGRFGEGEIVSSYPKGIVSRTEHCPLLESAYVRGDSNNYIRHYHKIRRWVWEQCDLLMVYQYRNLSAYENKEIKKIMQGKKPIVKEINDPQILSRINILITEMAGREGEILRKVLNGTPIKNICDEFGLSQERIRQLVRKANRNIVQQIKSENGSVA